MPPKLVLLLTAQINAKKPQRDPPIPELEVSDLLTLLGGPDPYTLGTRAYGKRIIDIEE
jgi:hypothetical protein